MNHSLHRIYFLLLFVFLCSSGLLFSQSDDFPFPVEYVKPARGMNGNEVNWQMQDRDGFLWFITLDGLNRYDGYTFKNYSYSPRDSNTLSPGWFPGLIEDRNGTLWFPSGQGLYSFDKEQEKFTNYRYQKNNPNSLSNDDIYSLETDSNGIFWMGTELGLEKFDPGTKKFTHYRHVSGEASSISGTVVFAAIPGKENIIWLVNNSHGLDCFNSATGKVTDRYKFPYPYREIQWKWSHTISGIQRDIIWIGSDDNGMYGFNVVSRQFVKIDIHHQCKSPKHYDTYYNVLEDHAGNLWTINDNNEIVYYDRKIEKFYFYRVNENAVSFFQLPGLLMEDRGHKIWLGTTNGLVTIDLERKKINVCRYEEGNPASISSDFVCGILRAKNGQVYVGTSANVDLFNPEDKSFRRLKISSGRKEIEDLTLAWHIYEDSRNHIWISHDNGLLRYDPESKRYRQYTLFENCDSTGTHTGGTGILEDKSGRFWVSSWGGLFLLDTVTNRVKNFNRHNSPLPSNSMGSFCRLSNGKLLIGNWEGGFVMLNPETEQFKIYRHDAKDTSSLSNETCHSFFEMKNGLIWFATNGGGINVFNPATEKFRAFTTDHGLAHNYVPGMTQDKNGNLWAGTYGGVSCFTPPENPFAPDCIIKFRNYNESDGLSSNICQQLSAYCDQDSTLYFGTRNGGMFYFKPGDLKDNDFIPPVYITGFSLLNKEVSPRDSGSVLKTPIEFTKEISLNYKQNILSFTFTALNFIHPEKNKYAYKLEGYDKDWIYTDASKRFATYTNLDPGEYVFKVKGSNNDGIWNDTPTELSIRITPPFWRTVWFKILVILSILYAAFAFYRYRIGQILLLQRIRNKIAADLHDDIGSTLNSISVFSEVARKDGNKRDHALQMIGESSRKIIESMSDIVWSINPINDSFDKIIFRMRSLAYNMLKAKKIDCSFQADDTLSKLNLAMETRRNFYLIFKEALNNMVKYSNASRASILISHERGSVTCIVRDDGVGFDTSAEYSGNGLTNMKKRAEDIGAVLLIDSAVGKGTSIEWNIKI